jgi:hypothetical protein
MSEAAKHRPDTWERYVRPALADYRGWASFPTTPEGQNWLYKLWGFGRNPEFPDYEAWRFPSWDNIVIYPGGRNDPEIKLLEATTSPEWFAQEIAADFTAFVGKIYGEFNEDEHVRTVKFDPALPNYVAFDWGFTNPLAAIEFQITPMDEIRIWREHYKPYTILSDHLDIMRNREQPPGYRIDMCFGDAASPESVAQVSRDFAPCYGDPEAKVDWRTGVELVKSFLRGRDTGLVDEFGTPLTVPGLAVDFSCPNTIREFNNYKAAPSVGKGVLMKSPREGAQGIDDHALDAIRYALVHIYMLGATHHLAEVWTPPAASDNDYADNDTADSGFFAMSKEF